MYKTQIFIKMNSFFSRYKFYFFIYLLLLWSCKGDVAKNLATKPIAMGRINNVVIIAEKNMTEGAIADTVSYYFECAYPILTAVEPMFDIRYMTPEQLIAKPYSKELRTYVLLADISDATANTTKMLREDMGDEKFNKALSDPQFTTSVGHDKWANGQMIIYIFAAGRENLAAAISKNFVAISKKINQHDHKNLSATVFGIQSVNTELSKLALDSFGLIIKIPGLYQKAIFAKNFLWVRMDDQEMNQSIVFRKFPYKDKNQFKMENIIKMRNAYGKEFIRMSSDTSYMSTNVIDLPTYEYTYFHNNVYTREVRGIWEAVNDFKGGPFVSYVLLNETKGEIVFIDTFVFAPGKEKRDFVQQLDCIIKTSSFPGVVKK